MRVHPPVKVVCKGSISFSLVHMAEVLVARALVGQQLVITEGITESGHSIFFPSALISRVVYLYNNRGAFFFIVPKRVRVREGNR